MNNCPKCGNALQPGQDFCTNCGNQVNNANQQNMNQPMNNDMNQQMNMGQPMNNDMNQQMNMGQPMNNGMNQQMNMNQPMNNGMNQQMNMGQPKGNKKKSNNNSLIIIVVAIIAIAAVACVAIIFLSGKDKEANNGSSDSGKVQEVSDTKANTASYQGFTFNVPAGFEAEENPATGFFVFYSDELALGIRPDFTNSFEAYRTYFAQEFNVDAASLSRVINGTEYLVLPLQDSTTGSVATCVVYDTKEGAVILGELDNAQFVAPTVAELEVMDSILSSCKKTSTFAAPTEEQEEITKPVFKGVFPKEK